MYVASFGGALHSAVTTYYYLEIGASTIDIGTLGFIMSGGALLGAPLCGMALDTFGPWYPISVTATACSIGCFWRGMASSLTSLRMGAILLGVGVNMWTVILGHLVKSFSPSRRSEIISGFGVQIAVLQLVGKGMFPLMEYGLHHILGIEDALLRYRIHMGTCTLFCFYGTFALFWDKKNVVERDDKTIANGGNKNIAAGVKYQQKHSDSIDDEMEEGGLQHVVIPDIHFKEMELVDSTNYADTKPSSFSDDRSNTSTSSTFLNEPNPSDHGEQSKFFTVESKTTFKKSHSATTIILTAALLLQSIATTVFIVLWPLLVRDRFKISAHTFGILTFIASVVSTGAVASFPIIERLDRIGGKLRCAAWGFGACSLLSLLFCVFSFCWGGIESSLNGADAELISNDAQVNNSGPFLTQYDPIQKFHYRKELGLHAVSAVALQSALYFLEPSLKSNLSLIVNSSASSPTNESSLGGTIGFLQTLGSIGGMVGNIAGTGLYAMSKDITPNEGHTFLRGGSLPFVAIAFFMAIFSGLIWKLEEPESFIDSNERRLAKDIKSEPIEANEVVQPDRSCLALRETTYDLKLD
jgi:MFS family permease